jgi:TraY domain-containing protein
MMAGRGRPSLGERVPLGLRVTLDTKARLDAAARYSGRSLSQEAELRLEQSFDSDRLSRIEGLLHTLAAHVLRADAVDLAVLGPKPPRERFDFEDIRSEFELVQKGQFADLKADGPFGALTGLSDEDVVRFWRLIYGGLDEVGIARLIKRYLSPKEGDDRS